MSRSHGFVLAGYQNVPPAPGRETGVVQAPPAPASSSAPSSSGGPSGIMGILPLFVMVPLVLFLFLSSRSQNKKQAAALAALKKGDRVLTQSGLVGRVVEIGERYAKLEIAPTVKVEVLKTSLLGVDGAETQAAAEKK